MALKTQQRIAACIEYCGAQYSGWQYQTNAPSVQARVEEALSRVADEPIRVTAAGRTDAGVHGGGQVIHFDTRARRAGHDWFRGVNTHLPDDISLLWTQTVDDTFHARFGASERSYRYVILNRDAAPATLHGRVAWHPLTLDVEPMQQAAESLIGRHDFSAFRAAGCQSKSAERRVKRLRLGRKGAWVWLDISADGFLLRMVRNIAGTLVRIGEGRASVGWAGEVLASRDRRRAAATAPAAGLYLTRGKYPPRHRLPPPPAPCRFW